MTTPIIQSQNDSTTTSVSVEYLRMQQFVCFLTEHWPRELVVEFALILLGEEARAWWARKENHQS